MIWKNSGGAFGKKLPPQLYEVIPIIRLILHKINTAYQTIFGKPLFVLNTDFYEHLQK
jgi:hypothetical protein